MLYLACMGLVGSVVVDIIKPIFEEVSKLGNLPEQRRSNVPPYTYTVPNVRQPTVYYDDDTGSWFTLH
ncbi:hypothetical protein QCA50_002843 [Cerrena zonata]|uniref:Uncharacterized protein n=1 Tax=Cerrena zonata TaxID=2478898 RepID=A0AAW0GIW1_9APHY